jgi:hypothetical protein
VDEPFEVPYRIVVARLDDCEVTFAQIDFAEGIAETEQATGEQRTGEKKVEPDGNPYC